MTRWCFPRSIRPSHTAPRCPGPSAKGCGRRRGSPGAYVVLAGGDPILYLERAGRALQTLVPAEDPRLQSALEALVEQVQRRLLKRLALEKVDGESAMVSALGPALIALGFQEGPRRLTLSA